MRGFGMGGGFGYRDEGDDASLVKGGSRWMPMRYLGSIDSRSLERIRGGEGRQPLLGSIPDSPALGCFDSFSATHRHIMAHRGGGA